MMKRSGFAQSETESRHRDSALHLGETLASWLVRDPLLHAHGLLAATFYVVLAVQRGCRLCAGMPWSYPATALSSAIVKCFQVRNQRTHALTARESLQQGVAANEM
eukprot:scaffold155997_cov15-Tisochrysis_lutea.AAC.2